MTAQIRKEPCSACPYRRDVASGVWAEHEYDKLVPYDAPTGQQPIGAFSCHATPEHYCHGWAVVHSNRGHEHDLLALRLRGCPEIPEAAVPLFDSGQEAAEHGKTDIENPSAEAHATVVKLQRKHERLR